MFAKEVALLCLNKNATVHVVHVFSKDVAAACREADVLICAAPVQNLIKKDMVKPGAVIIDVGINRVGDKILGDVEFEGASQRAAYITPVPGGVGPITTTILMRNTVELFKGQL